MYRCHRPSHLVAGAYLWSEAAADGMPFVPRTGALASWRCRARPPARFLMGRARFFPAFGQQCREKRSRVYPPEAWCGRQIHRCTCSA